MEVLFREYFENNSIQRANIMEFHTMLFHTMLFHTMELDKTMEIGFSNIFLKYFQNIVSLLWRGTVFPVFGESSHHVINRRCKPFAFLIFKKANVLRQFPLGLGVLNLFNLLHQTPEVFSCHVYNYPSLFLLLFPQSWLGIFVVTRSTLIHCFHLLFSEKIL